MAWSTTRLHKIRLLTDPMCATCACILNTSRDRPLHLGAWLTLKEGHNISTTLLGSRKVAGARYATQDNHARIYLYARTQLQFCLQAFHVAERPDLKHTARHALQLSRIEVEESPGSGAIGGLKIRQCALIAKAAQSEHLSQKS